MPPKIFVPTSTQKRHPLQPNRQHGWHTGTGKDGNQYFLGMDADAAICLRFTPEGNFEGAEMRCFATEGIPVIDLDGISTDIGHTIPATIVELNPAGSDYVARWASELIEKEHAVHLIEFEFPERKIGVRQMPAEYQAFLESPWAYDEEERFGFAVRISRWRETDRFVVHWHGEHWCAKDGLVHS